MKIGGQWVAMAVLAVLAVAVAAGAPRRVFGPPMMSAPTPEALERSRGDAGPAVCISDYLDEPHLVEQLTRVELGFVRDEFSYSGFVTVNATYNSNMVRPPPTANCVPCSVARCASVRAGLCGGRGIWSHEAADGHDGPGELGARCSSTGSSRRRTATRMHPSFCGCRAARVPVRCLVCSSRWVRCRSTRTARWGA